MVRNGLYQFLPFRKNAERGANEAGIHALAGTGPDDRRRNEVSFFVSQIAAAQTHWQQIECRYTATIATASNMPILPDILEPGLKVVFCATAVSTRSAQIGHTTRGRAISRVQPFLLVYTG